MSAHTPGPWHTDGASIRPDSQHMVPYVDGSLPKIALVMPLKSDLYTEKKDQHKGCITAGTPEANAHLIAAAPDLLAALRGQQLLATGCWCGGIHGHDEACLAAQAAIAKAEGR